MRKRYDVSVTAQVTVDAVKGEGTMTEMALCTAYAHT